MGEQIRIEADGTDVLVWVTAVPGASRDEIAGALGDRLKVRVSAAPEGGAANRAVCALLARALGANRRDVTIESGTTSRQKTVRITGWTPDEVRTRLA